MEEKQNLIDQETEQVSGGSFGKMNINWIKFRELYRQRVIPEYKYPTLFENLLYGYWYKAEPIVTNLIAKGEPDIISCYKDSMY